jgi:hypothetical protein
LISTADMAPTILFLANVGVPKRIQGCKLTGILDQTQGMSLWRKEVFMENLFLQDMFTARLKLVNLVEVNSKLNAENKSYRSKGG